MFHRFRQEVSLHYKFVLALLSLLSELWIVLYRIFLTNQAEAQCCRRGQGHGGQRARAPAPEEAHAN